MKINRGMLAAVLVGFGFAVLVEGQSAARQEWVGSWAASQQIPEPQNALPSDDLRDATLRQIVHLSAGGSTLRVHVSNAFGTSSLHLTSVHIARPVSSSAPGIDAATDKALTFSGKADVIIPAGAEYLSDPVENPVAPLSDLAVSIHYEDPPARETGHPGSRATSYLVHGDAVAAADLPDAKKVDHWYQLSAIDVGVTKTRNIGMLNQGIGGNHLLTDGLGTNALARFDRDVLARAGVRWLIVFEGVNDLGGLTQMSDPPHDEHLAFVDRVIASYEQIVARAHAAHIQVFGATITPYTGSGYYHPPASNEADRQAINQWIRAPGHFDAVIDFDKAVADPAHPNHLAPGYDCGDHLHPSPAGYRVMGELIPLGLFRH